MQLTCPCCRARMPLEAAMPDDAGRDMAALLAGLEPALARPLTSYIGLFRARSTQLGWDRALRLAREVLALGGDLVALQAALAETLVSMDEKRALPGWKPLGNHNYLKRVLESVAGQAEAALATAVVAPGPTRAKPAPRSYTGQALTNLQAMKRGGTP